MQFSSLFPSFIRLLLVSGLFLTSGAHAEQKPVLTIYTYDSFSSEWGPGPKIEAGFESICECDLKFIAVDSSTGILSRVLLEGESAQADIVLGLDNSLLTTARETGLIAPHQVDIAALDLPINWQDADFLPFDFGYFAFIFNTETLANPPSSFEELIEMDEQIKIVIQDPRTSTPGLGLLLWVKSVYGDRAADFWRRLKPRILTVTQGWSEAYGMFVEGEADMVLSYTTSPAYHMIAEQAFAYQAAGFESGHGMQIEVAAVLKNAPNPALAHQFMDYIVSNDFQSIIPTGNWMYPVTRLEQGLPAEFDQLVQPSQSLLIDSDDIAQNKKAWIAEFNQALAN